MTIEENERPNVGNDQWSEYPQGYVIGWSSAGWLILEPTAAQVAATAQIVAMTYPRLSEPEALPGRIRAGIPPGSQIFYVVPAIRIAPPTQFFFYPEPLPLAGRVTTGFVVAVVAPTVVTAITIRAVQLVEPESLRAQVRAGLLTLPPPAFRLRAAAQLPEESNIRGAIRTAVVVLPWSQATIRPATLVEPEALRGRIYPGITPGSVTFYQTPAIRIGGQVVEPEVLTGKFAVGFAVAPPVVATIFQAITIRAVQLYSDEAMPGIVRPGIPPGDVRFYQTPAVVVRPVVLPEAEQLRGSVRAATPLPPFPILRTTTRLEEPETLSVRPRSVIVIAPVAFTMRRPAQLEPVTELAGRISLAVVVAAAPPPVVVAFAIRPVVLPELEQLRGQVALGLVVTVALATPAITIRAVVLFEPEAPRGQIAAGIFVEVAASTTGIALRISPAVLAEPEQLPASLRGGYGDIVTPLPPPPNAGDNTGHGSEWRPGQGRVRDTKGRFARPWPRQVIRLNYHEDGTVDISGQELPVDEWQQLLEAPVIYRNPEPLLPWPTTDDELILLLS